MGEMLKRNELTQLNMSSSIVTKKHISLFKLMFCFARILIYFSGAALKDNNFYLEKFTELLNYCHLDLYLV